MLCRFVCVWSERAVCAELGVTFYLGASCKLIKSHFVFVVS